MAKALAANGAKAVYILGRREASLQSAASQSPHGNIIPIVTDVSSQESLEAAAAKIRKEHGYVNAVIRMRAYPVSLMRSCLLLDQGRRRFRLWRNIKRTF